MARTLYLDNDCDVILRSPKLAGTGSPLAAATVTWTLRDAAAVQLGTGVCTYDGTSDYVGVIESSVFSSQAVGAELTLHFTLSQAGIDAAWVERKCAVRERPLEV